MRDLQQITACIDFNLDLCYSDSEFPFAILKKELGLEASMYEILEVLGVMLFEKTPLKSLFPASYINFSKKSLCNQLLL